MTDFSSKTKSIVKVLEKCQLSVLSLLFKVVLDFLASAILR